MAARHPWTVFDLRPLALLGMVVATGLAVMAHLQFDRASRSLGVPPYGSGPVITQPAIPPGGEVWPVAPEMPGSSGPGDFSCPTC